MKQWILLVGSLMICNAQAADWVAVPAAGGADQYFYDRSKLTIKEDDILYWKKVAFKTAQEHQGKLVLSGLLHERMNCAEHTTRLLGYLYYAASGDAAPYTAQEEPEPQPVIPDSVGDAFEQVLCPMVWRKQEEARIKAEQKAASAELAEKRREDKKTETKPATNLKTATPPPAEKQIAPAEVAAPIPAPQIMELPY